MPIESEVRKQVWKLLTGAILAMACRRSTNADQRIAVQLVDQWPPTTIERP